MTTSVITTCDFCRRKVDPPIGRVQIGARVGETCGGCQRALKELLGNLDAWEPVRATWLGAYEKRIAAQLAAEVELETARLAALAEEQARAAEAAIVETRRVDAERVKRARTFETLPIETKLRVALTAVLDGSADPAETERYRELVEVPKQP